MPENEEANPLYEQLLAIQENAAQIVEQAEEQFCASISFLDWDALTVEEREQVHTWHRSVQKAALCIRNLEEE